MNWLACAAVVCIALASCKSPPPPPPGPVGKPVAWPRPEPARKPAASARKEPARTVPPGPPSETARPHDDEPNPGEAIQQSEKAKEDATAYVLNPRAQAPVIDTLTRLARDVRRARDAMEQRRAATGTYDPEDVRALTKATDALDNYRNSKGD